MINGAEHIHLGGECNIDAVVDGRSVERQSIQPALSGFYNQ